MSHTTEDPELGEVKKDPRDTLIEAQRGFIIWLLLSKAENLRGIERPFDLEVKEMDEFKIKIQAAEKAIKGG